MVDGLMLADDQNERFGPPLPAQSGTYNRRPMPLLPGTRLGPYQVASPLGAGGMGEVYAARDTRLERSVAIKVLPREFTDDAGRRARFEREAAAIASLSHPNICTLHDVGQQDGTMFLVMEKLDGVHAGGAAGARTHGRRRRRSPAPSRSPRAWPSRIAPGSCIGT